MIAGARLRQKRRITAHEMSFLKGKAPGPIKMTIPSPSVFMLMSYVPGVTDRVYPSRSEFLAEIVEIITHVGMNILTNLIGKASEVDIDFPKVSLQEKAA